MRTRLLASMGLLLALVLAVPQSAANAATPARADAATPSVTPYSLLQMNLCLSGLAGCFGRTQYPKVVDEAIEKVRSAQPDVVTLNEACSGDVERIARETGMDFRFSTVIYNRAQLPCRNPGDRGVFGNGVLTKKAITAVEDRAYTAQLGAEERRYVCVTTEDGIRVCATHLAVGGNAANAANNTAQCAELAAVLAAGAPASPLGIAPTILSGDVNRQGSCASPGYWTERDSAATQQVGIQHTYGTAARLLLPVSTVIPMVYTDHDALLTRALFAPSLSAGIAYVSSVADELAATREIQPSAARDIAKLIDAATMAADLAAYEAVSAVLSGLDYYVTSARPAKVSADAKSQLLALLGSWLGQPTGLRAFTIQLAAQVDAGAVKASTAKQLRALVAGNELGELRAAIADAKPAKVSAAAKQALLPLVDAAALSAKA
ncbi:endonuclease/exonuclease/phosphatase family protein [Motilibacter aurantiacus]|uniref:endonuclease/exonuclease/phosphatase family protein n=1 Tax=Motilibacter aurantiacus TaxID=2714955 RepID=UPI001408C194|nr:endonuclease/exonuclease/phosphatase family protein [Motilibacter aurantiacus]NHC45086.1 hypothetical protein [Motilibacter aurantiacus]